MTLKGNYDPGTSYEVGDVVKFSDMAYVLKEPAAAGTPPNVDRVWERLDQRMWDVIDLILDGIGLAETAAKAYVDSKISDDAIVLAGTTTPENDYLITVDDSGLTPELAVELIEPEEEAET